MNPEQKLLSMLPASCLELQHGMTEQFGPASSNFQSVYNLLMKLERDGKVSVDYFLTHQNFGVPVFAKR